jgi:hypothetical protein
MMGTIATPVASSESGVEGIRVWQKAGYGIREKVAVREGRSPRDTLSLLIVYLSLLLTISDRS